MDFVKLTSLFSLTQAFPTEDSCLTYLEQHFWKDGVISPFDPTSKVYNYGNHKYRCKNTGKNFTVRTNTLFHGSKISLRKWFMAIWLIANYKKGISSCQLAKEIEVRQATAWHMLHRIRECFFCENDYKLDGEVELDETFVGGKNKNRHHNKKVKHSQGRSFKDKTPVLGMLQRGGKVVCRVVKSTSKKHLTAPILRTVKRTAKLYTDEWCGYDTVGKLYERKIVDHGKGQYVCGNAYTNTIEGFWSGLKRGIIGIYHKVSRKHLCRYVNEFVFRYNTKKISSVERFNLLLCNINYRTTYQDLIK